MHVVFRRRHYGRREVDPYRHLNTSPSCASTPPDWRVARLIVLQIPSSDSMLKPLSWCGLSNENENVEVATNIEAVDLIE